MKRILCIGLSATAMLLANTSHADFTFHSSMSDACEFVSGKWTVSGKGSNWFVGECKYHGIGTISTLDATGHFKIDVSADKDSGSFLCPDHDERQLDGKCVNGVVTILTEFGDISGNFSQNSGTAQGTLSGMGIEFDVSARFQRANA